MPEPSCDWEHRLTVSSSEGLFKRVCVVAILGEVFDGLILKAFPPWTSASCHRDTLEAKQS